MKNLFVLLIFVPLFVSIKIPFTDWEWNWDFDWDFSQFIENIKSGVPDFINNFKTEILNFLKEDELGKRKWIKNLADQAKAEYDKIKNKTTENVAKLAQFTTQAAQYMSYQICNATNMESYEECRNNKKEVFSQLVQIVHDRFQCSKIITIVTENIIAGDVNQSLKYEEEVTHKFFIPNKTKISQNLRFFKTKDPNPIFIFDEGNLLKGKMKKEMTVMSIMKLEDIENN